MLGNVPRLRSLASSRPIRGARGLALAVVVAALAAVGSATQPTRAVAASCPDLPISVDDLITLRRQGGPLAKAFSLGVTPMNERALACYGSRDLTFSAFVNQPDGVGGTTSFAITPAWIVGGSLIVFGSSREVSPGYGDGPFFFVSTRPSAGDLQRTFARRWVTIRGHFDDPAATSCRASGPAGVTPSDLQAVAICRTMFVLSSIRKLEAPDTATSPQPERPARAPWSGAWLGAAAGVAVALLVARRATPNRRPQRRRPG